MWARQGPSRPANGSAMAFDNRTGAGTMKHPGPPPAVVAERLAKMHVAAKATREERKAEQRRWLEALAEMPVEELRRVAPAGVWGGARGARRGGGHAG